MMECERKIGCIGCGYVGSLTMIVLAYKNAGHHFTLTDCNAEIIKAYQASTPPFHEPFLDEYMEGCRKRANISFTTDIDSTILNSHFLFVAVDTPSVSATDYLNSKYKGRKANLSRLKEVAVRIGRVLLKRTEKLVVVLKSTIPIGAEEKFMHYLEIGYGEFNPLTKPNYSVYCMPEFLAEGSAIRNLLHPDRIIIGQASNGCIKEAQEIRNLYGWVEEKQIIYTNAHTAELGKMASNAMLAQRISAINSLTAVCEATGADISVLKQIVGSDSRIGPNFLNPSPGFGGSCFKKDILSLVYICEKLGFPEVASYWSAIVDLNEFQKKRLAQKIVNSVDEQSVAIFGAAFKEGTSDVRDSAAITICCALVEAGIQVKIFDPKASYDRFLAEIVVNGIELNHTELELLHWASSPYEAAADSRAIVLLTEWTAFSSLDYKTLYCSMLPSPFVFDFRLILKAEDLRAQGFNVFQLGVQTISIQGFWVVSAQ